MRSPATGRAEQAAVSEEAIAAALSAAEQWRLKGDARWELNALSSALRLALELAVGQGPFWREYGRALGALHNRTAYSTPTLKLQGYERYFRHCLLVVQALTTGSDTIAAELRSAQEAFAKRNADRRLRGGSGFDGDGLKPVRWDLRITSIQVCWSRA
jgi:uncharacterized protein YjiS (DUF1127 family)